MKNQVFFIGVLVFLQMKRRAIPIIIGAANCLLPTISFAQIIAAGGNHSLAVCADNAPTAWGYNAAGQLGNGTNANSSIPVPVSNLSGVIAIAGGDDFSIALKQDGTVWTWGINSEGQLGNGTTGGSTNIPGQVSNLSGVIAITGGGQGHCLALKNDSTVWAWGRNFGGELGDSTFTESNVPVKVSNLSGMIAIAEGSYHSLALKSDGTVWVWGDNFYGELGDGTNINRNVPVQVSSLTGITAIAGGGYHSIVLKNDGTVWTCGYNPYGELGDGTNTNSNVPVQVSNISNAIDIIGGGFYSLALTQDGTIWTWGSNSHGELGNGSTIGGSSNIPVQVSNLSGVLVIGAGFQHGLALRQDGSVWAWGNNIYGSLGDGNSATDSNIPVQVTGLCQLSISVNEITEPLSISVFPNLFENEFTIHGTKEKGVATIFDITGRQIRSEKTLTGETKINTAFLIAGVYFLNYREENKTVNLKLIKCSN